MSEWWERGYPGAPMVKVQGFPRALYPPDAARYGKQPSADGPDVEAYKRTVSRAGRWPWQSFDDTYSNGFAHGTSGNVADTGIAGVQRQGSIDDTGWLGKSTFNLLRSIVIPEGLPHAGEHAMDATAVRLINDAWQLFGGHEPAPPGETLRTRALDKATSQLGVVESPADSNRTPYGAWYGADGQPWCAMFTTWCYEHAGDSPSFVRGSRYAFVPYIVGDARAGRYGLMTTDDPIPGDLVCYDWQSDGTYDHVGIFEGWGFAFGDFSAIEGNTSAADNSNGGQVQRRSRNRSAQGTTFVRVAEA
jgi:CHAP domain-containing protein